MKITNITHDTSAFNIDSINHKVEANITKIHPLLDLENGAKFLVFSSDQLYYDFIGNANAYNVADQDVNLDYLKERVESFDDIETMSFYGKDVNYIEAVNLDDNGIIYILTSIITGED
jgi:hypothetical protein